VPGFLSYDNVEMCQNFSVMTVYKCARVSELGHRAEVCANISDLKHRAEVCVSISDFRHRAEVCTSISEL
jgi:hypothetical protein